MQLPANSPSTPCRQIVVQCVVLLAVGTWGVLGLQANFVPIRTTTHLAKQYAIAQPRVRPVAALTRPPRPRSPAGPRHLLRNRTVDSLDGGPDFVHFNTRELR